MSSTITQATYAPLYSKQHLIDLLKSGEVVVIDKKTGKYLTEFFGVPLPSADEVMEKAVLNPSLPYDPNKIM